MKPNPSFLGLWLRVLTFRATAADYEALGAGHLLAGFVVVWLVGMGRYWDDPRATTLQHHGLGSLIYIFILAAVLWALAKPVDPQSFDYLSILTFVTMTAPPAALYAIPIEKWLPPEEANLINLRFLAIVALWRLGLWTHYLWRSGNLTFIQIATCALLPVGLIFTALTVLNLQHHVIDVMGGIRDAEPTAHDAAHSAVTLLIILTLPLSGLAALSWIILVARRP